MRNDVYRLLVLAVACNLSCDQAYDMLQQDFIDGFASEYGRVPVGPQKPVVLDALIDYTMRELPIRTGVEGSIVFELKSRRDTIVRTFIEKDVSEMITQLAAREGILELIRGYLRKENTMSSMYGKINSSRTQGVFNQFLEVFKRNCAHAFEYDGKFQDFVMHCFINFFYKGRKQDIWSYMREVDTTRREIEMSIVQEKMLHVSKTDDVLIHDLLLNISLVNDMLFRHSGQSDEARGVQYDIYYLVLCKLCEERVAHINEELGEEILQFVDPRDRKENRAGLVPNKGIAAKITNAKALVARVFDYVRNGQLNTSNLADLRDQCFKLGKHDREGRNCVWSDVTVGGETSRYLDTDSAARNYSVFDQLLKGVVSVHTLMTELESRGYYLVDNYDSELFINKEIIRYMDYLSSVKYIGLMKELQEEPVDYTRYGKDLLEFPAMVDEYAGSAVNNHTNIRENRYWAITHGFLVKPRVKQSSLPIGRFEELHLVAAMLDAVPRSYRDYIQGLHYTRQEELRYQHWIILPPYDVVAEKYANLYSNHYVVECPDKADYYLRGDGQALASECLDDLRWAVGTSCYTGVEFAGAYGVYVPLERAFLFYDVKGVQQPFLSSWEDIQLTVNEKRVNGRMQIVPILLDQPILPVQHLAGLADRLVGSIGFSYEVGFANLAKSDVQSRLSKIGLNGKYRVYLEKYYTWLDECSRAQHSFIEVLKTIFTEVVYLLAVACNMDSRRKEYLYAQELCEGLMSGEFNVESLDWVLKRIYEMRPPETCDWACKTSVYAPLDISILDCCFNECRGSKYPWFDFVVGNESSPSKRFILMYNHVYTKLEFLRYLRDAYSLMLDTMPEETSTLVCELSQRFNVIDKLKGFQESVVTYGARTEDMSYVEVKQGIWATRSQCISEFKTLLTELDRYVHECEDEIAKLIEYNIAAQSNINSRFSEWGVAFAFSPDYPPMPELQELRKRATLDGAGFFLLNGSYFKGRNGTTEYYVHRSGRMVTEYGSKFEASEFDFSSETDRQLYRNILLKGLNSLGY